MRKKTKRKTTKKTQEFIVAVMDKKTKEKHFFSFENRRSRDGFINDINLKFPKQLSFLLGHISNREVLVEPKKKVKKKVAKKKKVTKKRS